MDAANLHKRIGMSGKLLIEQCAQEIGAKPSSDEMAGMDASHAYFFEQLEPKPRALNDAMDLLRALGCAGIAYGIATSGKRPSINSSLASLELPTNVVVVDGSQASSAKPEPDVFVECQRRLGVPASGCFVVGDAVWDLLAARRAGLLAVALLSGGTSEEALYRAGAYRVYSGPVHLQASPGELGIS